MAKSLPAFPPIPFPVDDLVFLWHAGMGVDAAYSPAGDVDLDFARAGEARTWRETAAGWVIDVAASGVPRYSRGGLVMERGGADGTYPINNLCLYSEAQDNGAYGAVGTGSAAAAAGVAAPESGKTSYELIGGAAGDGWKQALTLASKEYTFQVALKASTPCNVGISMDGGTTVQTVRLTTTWQVFMCFRAGTNPIPSVIVGDTTGNHIYTFGWQVTRGYIHWPAGYVPTTNAAAGLVMESLTADIADIANFPTDDNPHTLAACGVAFGDISDGLVALTTNAATFPDGGELSAAPYDIMGSSVNKWKYSLWGSGTDTISLAVGGWGSPMALIGTHGADMPTVNKWLLGQGYDMAGANQTADFNGGTLYLGGIAAGSCARQLHGALYVVAIFKAQMYAHRAHIMRWMQDMTKHLMATATTGAALATDEVTTDKVLTTAGGSATAEAHTADEVLHSAGGNYVDENLSVETVKVTVPFGLGFTGALYAPAAGDVRDGTATGFMQTGTLALPAVGNVRPVGYGAGGTEYTGTLANLAATDAAYVTLENSRNNDNGTVAADLATGKSVKIRDVTTNGSATVATQTSTPGTWTLADSGDGQTWTLDVPAGAALTVYTLIDQSSFAKVGSCVKPNGMKVKGLTAGRTYHLVATYPGQTESAESATEVVAPALVANYSAGTAAILTGSADRVDGLVTNGTASAGATPPDACHLAVSVSGTTASIALSNLPAAATSVKVYHRLAGEDTWILGATITMPNTTGSIAGLTKSKLYEFQAITFNGTQVGYPSNLERKWVADTSKFKAILNRVEAEIEALAWTGWATSQVTIAWSPALVKDKAMPRVAVAPGNAPDSIVAQTNTSYSVAFPVRLYLMDRVSTRDAQMEALLTKREALRQLFMQRNVLSEVEGVFNVRVEPLPVVNDPDIDERMLITGVELAVEVEEAR